jgi:hypothetical protein
MSVHACGALHMNAVFFMCGNFQNYAVRPPFPKSQGQVIIGLEADLLQGYESEPATVK